MSQPYRIYMDVCCLNRPFDNLEQDRIRIEAEATQAILNRCETQQWILMNSDAIIFEIAQNPDRTKAERTLSVLNLATQYISLTTVINQRAEELTQLGFKFYDALHLAFAEAAQLDIFLTTDDRLLRKAQTLSTSVKVKVRNPVIWWFEILQQEGANDEII